MNDTSLGGYPQPMTTRMPFPTLPRRPSRRVAVIGSSRFSASEPFCGGLEAHTLSTVRALQRCGHHVTLFAGPADRPTPIGVETHPIVAASPDFGDAARSDTQMTACSVGAMDEGYRRTLEIVDDRGLFDVVHNNSLHAWPVLADVHLSVPMVHVLHCPPFHELEDAHRRRRRSSVPSRLGDVIAVSDTLSAAWAGTATTVVSNGVPVSDWTPESQEPIAAQCAWVGRIVEEKGPHLAIDAARRAGVPIVLAGPVQQRNYFDEFVRPRLGRDARHVGHLDRSSLARLFATSSVGVVTPRWEEPFGLVAAEMLACGLPVAAFDRGAMSAILDARTGCLARADDVDDLAAAIRRCSLLDRAECRLRAVDHLSDDHMVDRYVDAYELAILRRNPTHGPEPSLITVA